jgi:hypothetical protein
MKPSLLAVLAALPLAGCFPFEERIYQPAINPVTAADVGGMAAAGYSDAMILDMIRANGVLRKPTADELVAMKDAGVRDPVLAAMLEAPVTVPRPAVETHVHTRDPWYPYYYYPSVSVGLGFSYGYWGGRYGRCR